MFCFMNGDDFSIPVEQPHFVLVDAASISLCLAFLSVTNQFYANLGFFGMGCQTNSPPEAGGLLKVLDKNNRNRWQICFTCVILFDPHINSIQIPSTRTADKYELCGWSDIQWSLSGFCQVSVLVLFVCFYPAVAGLLRSSDRAPRF